MFVCPLVFSPYVGKDAIEAKAGRPTDLAHIRRTLCTTLFGPLTALNGDTLGARATTQPQF